MHPGETTLSNNLSGHRFWSSQPTEKIVESLKPGTKEALRVDKNGKVWQGNTRIMILQQRGYNVDSLPREPYP